VDIWYHSLAMGAVKRGDKVVGVEIATWMGRGAALGKIIIDATGDGDVCVAAGAQYLYLNDGDLALQEASFKDIGLYANVAPIDPIDIKGSTIQHALATQAGKLAWDFRPMAQIRETRLIKGNLVYAYAALRALAAWRPAAFTVTVDGAEPFEFSGYSVAVGNSRAYGGGMFITPHAELDDGSST
jgi:hypothetical protein